MSEENKTENRMKPNLLHDEHGEPTGLMYIAIVVILLAFGLIWSAAEKGWLKTLLDLF